MGYLKLLSTILLLSILLANSDGQKTKSSMSKTSKVGTSGGNRSPFGQKGSLSSGTSCPIPPAPVNGRVSCKRSLSEQTCTGECFDGYQFPDRSVNKLISCGTDGISRPTPTFPDCQAICDSPCQNGGTCTGRNICRCRKNFWGKFCETPVSVCNLQATHKVGYQCKIKKDVMTCSLECHEGSKFEFPPVESYTCTPSGKWNPPRIPNCIPDDGRSHLGDDSTKTNENIQGGSSGGQTHIESGDADCEVPAAPVNGRVSCKRSANKLTCTGECFTGYQFYDKSINKIITCDSDGILKPSAKFPKCEPICDPPCQNGGNCIGPGVCRCPKDFWGKSCDTPVSVCNLQATHRVGYECKIKNDVMTCSLVCGEGMKFEFPPAASYSCTPAGKWNPSKIPNCVPDGHLNSGGGADCQVPSSPVNGRVSCKRSSNKLTCTGECFTGYQFHDKSINKIISCGSDGILKPTAKFPNCEPICDPPCQNGGNCMGPGVCRCPKDYWGKSCDTPVSVCDLQATHHVGYECKIKSDVMTCSLVCGEGMKFEFPPAASYSCTPAGQWNPSQIPNCVPDDHSNLKYDTTKTHGGETHGGQTHVDTGASCVIPSSPINGRVSCRRSSKDLTCTGECFNGYQFPDGSYSKRITCDKATGILMPNSKFPDCQPICDPSCENGGTCVGKDNCVCRKEFWGKLCDTPVSVCDLQATHSVGYECNIQQESMSCVLACGEGMRFEFPPAAAYYCTPAGKWSPSEIPNCVFNDISRPNHEYNTKLDIGPGKTDIGVVSVIGHSANEIEYRTLSKLNGRCVSWQKKHFQTFDGRMFGFEGTCSYLLVSDCIDHSFSIFLNMEEDSVSLRLVIDNNDYDLKNHGGKPSLFVQGIPLAIPFAINNVDVHYVSHYIAVSSEFGFRLIWDGKNFVQVDALPQAKNRTCGLCGRYDDNPLNDMETNDGTLTDNEISLADSWIIQKSDTCDHSNYVKNTCQNLPADVLKQAKHHCNRIKNKLYEDCLYVDISCSENKVYQDCGSDCQASCSNPIRKCKSEWCNDGCFCTKGMLLGPKGKCYQPSDCPCFYKKQQYLTGSSVQQDCNICKCVGGQWHCTKEVCESRCSAVGDPHYTTFDGKHYNFMGRCSYYLISNENYSIEQEFIACDDPAAAKTKGSTPLDVVLNPSCTKTITIRTRGSELHLKQDYSMVLNGRELSSLPHFSSGMYIYRPSSSFIKIELMNGLKIQWDGESRLYIDAPPSLLNTLQGLCGTFTQTQKDDFLTPEGDVESNVNSFASKWKTDDFCADMPAEALEMEPCSIDPDLHEQAKMICDVIKSPTFEACHDEVDPEPYIANCIYDMCTCKKSPADDCLCSSIADYATICAKKGTVIEWRSKIPMCEIPCPSGQVFSQCSSSCSRSCVDIASNSKCEEQCVEGCNCPLGMTLDSDGECIPVSECSCLFDEDVYPAGYSSVREDQMCVCVNAVWECRVATPEEQEEALKSKQVSECLDADNMEPTDCLVECPLTCSNFHKPPICQTVRCKPGCKCKDGYIFDSKAKTCIKPSDCPCHHNDRTYEPNETMLQDCNLCLCENARWKCEKRECPGICYAWGETHVKTFDGRMFEFVGECEYTLAQGSLDSNAMFTVNVQSMPCGDTGITCFKSTTFILGDEKLRLSQNEPIPEPQGTSRFMVHKVGLYVIVHTDVGVTLYWDRGTRVYIKLQSNWKSGVTGLCGDFNDNEMNDFRSPLGGPILVRPTEFADSWRVHSYCTTSELVTNKCEKNPQRLAWAEKKCGVLKSELFSSCHSDVPVEPFLESCISDTCGCDIGNDCECTCTAIATYAQECNIIGKPIAWRSQELCPIQCRECDKYTPCMSICPKTTCETEFIYKELATTCKDEMCVEGCDPPACTADEIYKDDEEFKCIPKEECVRQPCSVINGVRYHEGERITDEQVVLPCQSCHCLDGKLNCVGEPCVDSLELTTTTQPSTIPPVTECNGMSHWSEWINSYQPTYENGGDYEIVKDLVQGPYDLCPLEYITAIECRDAKTHQLASTTGDVVHCSVSTGLICENSLQSPDPICRDYDVRLFCDCDKNLPTSTVISKLVTLPIQCTVPGWSVWMRTDEGGADKLSLRNKFSFCDDIDIIDVDCREVSTKKSSFEFENVLCTTKNGFECLYSDKSKCPAFEVRFNCHCEKMECDAKLGLEDGTISNNQITASSYLHENVDGKGARLNGKLPWSPELITSHEWIQVEMPEEMEITGIITQGSPTSKEWVTHFEVMYSSNGIDWKTIQQDDKTKVFIGNIDQRSLKVNLFPAPIYAKFIQILPTDWIHRISLRFELLGCNKEELPVTSRPFITKAPTCVKTGWTEWINTDTPNIENEYEQDENTIGDNEIISSLRYYYSFCETPTAIRCQTVDKKIPSHETGQIVSCDLKEGFKCDDSEQTDGKCLDYEVSLNCDCRTSTPYVTVPTTTESLCSGQSKGFTEWMSVGDPVTDSQGDVETIDDLRSKYEFCKDEHILDIECRTVGTHLDYSDADQKWLKCDVKDGFECLHFEQTNYMCLDYEVRFYCYCLEDVITTTEAVTKPEEVLAEGGTTVVSTKTQGALCAKWTGWINLSPVSAIVEEELLAEIDGFYQTCPIPIEIQCRQAYSHVDYTGFPYLTLDPACTLGGIRCDNSINDNKCPDFEINVLCECEPPSSTTPIPSAVIIPPKCTSGWTEWFNIDSPESAGGDFERLEDLRTHFEFCSDEEIIDVKCESVEFARAETGDGQIDFRLQAIPDKEVKCTKEFGLECFNSLQTLGKCHDYQITLHCACKDEQPPTISTTPYYVGPTVAPICDGWTDWFDMDSPDEDGIEQELFEDVKNFAQMCPIVDRVECNDIDSDEPYNRYYTPANLDEACTFKGIKCTGNDCSDYKIRAYCLCEPSTKAPEVCIDGWTDWFDTDDPESGEGDFEDINSIRLKHQFCDTNKISDVECKSVDGLIDIKETGDNAVKCNKIIGAACYNDFQTKDKQCSDYKIRFKCVCGATPAPPPLVVTSLCDDGYTWFDCAYDCDDVCHSFLVQAHKTAECPTNSDENESNCIAGCLKDECRSPKVWRDKNTCVLRSECNCLMDDGTMLGPGEVVDISECERCQCLNNVLNCYTVAGCGITSEAQVTPEPLIPIVQPDCWTSWINENAADKFGDSELVKDIRMKFEFCENPIKIECRVAENNVYVYQTNEGASCELEKGLQCKNNVGVKTKESQPCSDYEIRFYCPCENYTTSPELVLLLPAPCEQGFTDWFNGHQPDEAGEREQLSDIRQMGNLFCANEYVTSLQCRESRTKTPHYQSENIDLVCSLQQGFYCENENQPEGEDCEDFEVRYFCDCPTTSYPSTYRTTPTTTSYTTPITTTSSTAYVEITTTEFFTTMTSLPPTCAYWSRWLNDDNPEMGEGDMEKTTAVFLQRQENFCSEGDITNIECVDAITGVSFEETGDEILACTLELGLTCMNSRQPSQMCRDYKIRYYCSCTNYSTAYPTTQTTPTTILVLPIKPVTVAPCTEFYSLLDTVPDSNLKASSSFTSLTGPERARSDSDSAWSPKYSNKDQYLEIDLGVNQPVYGFVTRGHPTEQKWVTVYRVMYSRDGVTYDYYTKPNMRTPFNFPGPRISSDEEVAMLEAPFEARYIRILPQAWKNQIAMRINLLGCGQISTTTTTGYQKTTLQGCDEPMGFENHLLNDDQITVSSYRDSSRGPSRIRLNSVTDEWGTGGWVAEKSDRMQYIRIDFNEPRVLTGIETQGRHNADQYVESYSVQYSNDGKTWYDVLDENDAVEIFRGNYDGETPHLNYFSQPIRTRYLQITPLTWNNWISMRIEIRGCYEPYPTVPEKIAEFTVTTPSYTTVEILTPEYLNETEESEEVTELKCDIPMGLENGQLSDSQITLSSSWHGDRSGASRIRLNTPEDEETGGRPVHDEWVEAYTVSSSNDGKTWESVLINNKEKFTGNTDGVTPVLQYFDDVITARYLRIQPISWHNWIAMRLEVLGCSMPPTATATVKGGECEEYGSWINIKKPQVTDGDYESIDEIIENSRFCTNPIEIECRDSVTKIDYQQTGQKMQCDLTHGLDCKNRDQGKGQYCYDYEVRIVCYTCPEVTSARPPGLLVCPEVPISVAKNCPEYCPVGELCDGSKCVSPLHCACYMDGKKFQPGDRLQTVNCQECECQLDGYTTCRNKTCAACSAGLKQLLGKDCKCYCEPCAIDEIMCEVSKECIPRENWCDGAVDCPNKEDESNCPTTTPIPICPIPTCASGTILTIENENDLCPTYECELIEELTTTPEPRIPQKVTCDLYGNYFKTFDGEEYPYDICDHTLMRDKNEQKYGVTIHKECDAKTNYCTKYLLINQDQHKLRLDEDLTVEYNDQMYTPSQLIKLGQTIEDFSIRVVANSAIFKSKIYDFEVEWNKQQNVIVKVGESLSNKINGLCGLYNDNPSDDFETPSGTIASGSENFGNSWAIGPLERCQPEVCQASIKIQAVEICNNIILPPLDVCNQFVDSKFYLSACVSSMCDCLSQGKQKLKECECEAYQTYVEACKKEEPTVKIHEWRTKLGCSPTCPPGLVWKDCGPICERSCDNLQDDLSECEDSCVAGCYCPDGTVKKRQDTCVTVDKCQDCICDGYGDPHYNTFDRYYYPFQGNCTYVLARDKSPTGDHKFEVYITNDECREEPGTTCTTAIMVLYNEHIAHFRVNHSVMLDGVVLYASDFPMEYEGINVTITSAPDRTVTFRIDEISLEVRYFENNYGFQVRLPSDIYYGKTEGLCGNCNYDKSDDITTSTGVITNDTNEFSLSWLAVPPEDMEIVDSNCIVFEEKPCMNLLEKERCEAVLGPQFKACHLLVDPESVLRSCQFDVCHSLNAQDSLCRSLTEYARACAQVGVCIQNWRTENLCPIQCGEGMYYDQCGPACMKTCKNIDEHEKTENCEADPVEGCFCIGDRVLKDGVCVDPMECKKCDDEGHGIGDMWEPNVCTKCECTEDLTIACTKTACSPKPVCESDEILLSYPSNNDSCCLKYNCLLKPKVICPEVTIPSCAPGEVSKAVRGPDSCADFVCECDPMECPQIREPILTEIGQEVILDNSTCCAVKKVICNTEKCPPEPKCLPGEQLETYNENKCCPDQNCVPPKDQCYYSHMYDTADSNAAIRFNEKEALYKPGTSWNDGLCTKCACEGLPGHYNAHCQKEVCPELDPSIKKNYIIEEFNEPGSCCPQIKQILCRLDGNKFDIGQSLPSPDGDKCKRIECVAAPNGDAMKATITQSCTLDCPKGFEYEPPESTSKQCCGSCKPIACIELNEIYEVGEKWNSVIKKCVMAHCTNDTKVGVITQYETNCPQLAPNCPEDKIIRDPNDCCDICSVVPPTEDCTVKEIDLNETIKIFDIFHLGNECSNKYPIPGLKHCAGKCDSHTMYSADKKDFESTCLCCKQDQIESKTVQLDCSDGSQTPFTYMQPVTCTCSLCTEEEYVPIPPGAV
uniref:Hemocytin n=1 Tax=Strigamia maritima TaxID=126957 RepID=T1JAC2_STRMM